MKAERTENVRLDRRGFMALAAAGVAGSVFGESSVLAPPAAQLCGAVDFDADLGKLKRLNGTNTVLSNRGHHAKETIDQMMGFYKDMYIGTIRWPDVPLITSMPIVDVPMMFPLYNPKADPKDPDNYLFFPTDDYIRLHHERFPADTDYVYRLGPTPEHTYPRRVYSHSPRDYDQFAEACAGVMRHYTRGWANGFDAKIRYWEVWNEPDLFSKTLWEKPVEEFWPFYCKVAKRLKAEFDDPEIKIGGPAFASNKMDKIEAFLAYCRKENAPIDFFSWHAYLKDWNGNPPGEMSVMKALLTKYGYGDTELHLNEWRYFPCPSWQVARSAEGVKRWFGEAPDGLHGIDEAAMAARCMTRWSDTPLDVACFYQVSSWTIFRGRWPDLSLYPEGYALTFFGQMRHFAPDRVKASWDDDKLAVLASKDAQGTARRILVSVWKPSGRTEVKLSLKGVAPSGRVRVRLLTCGKPPVVLSLDYADGTLVLPAHDASFVCLVEFN